MIKVKRWPLAAQEAMTAIATVQERGLSRSSEEGTYTPVRTKT